MIDVEISVVPIGTNTTSISEFVAESEKVLKKYPDLSYKLTAMSTEIEGRNINEIFDALKEMHLAQINKGAKRVQTSINIDDRRDKEYTFTEKVLSVRSKLF
ncbi:MAG: MTH1187 family thiamine-binding protein [bacterium]